MIFGTIKTVFVTVTVLWYLFDEVVVLLYCRENFFGSILLYLVKNNSLDFCRSRFVDIEVIVNELDRYVKI